MKSIGQKKKKKKIQIGSEGTKRLLPYKEFRKTKVKLNGATTDGEIDL